MTNNSTYRKILIPLFFALLILFAINFQTTIWFGFFGSWPAPVLWPTVFVYLCTNRERKIRGAWLVFFFLMICSYSVAVPLAIFLSLIGLAYLIRFTQKRFSAIDTTDLIAFSVIATFLFPLLYAIIASVDSEFEFQFWSNVISTILSIPMIPVMLYLSRRIDRILNLEEGFLLAKI